MAEYGDLFGLEAADFLALFEAFKASVANGVISGMSFTVTGSNLHVTVNAGQVRSLGTLFSPSQTDVDFTGVPNASNPTKALIVVTSSGVVTKRVGAASPAAPTGSDHRQSWAPSPPALVAGDVVLYEVWLAAGATVLTSADLSDRRIIVASDPAVPHPFMVMS